MSNQINIGKILPAEHYNYLVKKLHCDELTFKERQILDAHIQAKCIIDYRSFCQYMLPNNDEFVWSWYHFEIIKVLQKMIDQGRGKLILEMPNQHGKSLIVANLLISYMFGRFPEKKLIYVTYNEDRAKSVMKNIGDFIQSDNFTNIFPESRTKWNAEIKDSLSLKRNQATNRGFTNINSMRGEVKAIGRDNVLTGEPAHLLVIDDIYKSEEEAYSANIRDKVYRWWVSSAKTRQQINTIVIVTMSRWHSQDLVGMIKKENEENTDPNYINWHTITFPAQLEAHHDKHDYDHRQVGEYLDKRKMHIYADLRKDPIVWKSLAQQEPADDVGFLFKREYIEWYDKLPDSGSYWLSIDPNKKLTATSDAVGITVWLIRYDDAFTPRFYLVNFFEEKHSSIDLVKRIDSLAIIYNNPNILIETENGDWLVELVKQKHQNVFSFITHGVSKFERAQLAMDEFYKKKVFLPLPSLVPHIEKYVLEWLGFTGKTHGKDNLVDSTSQLIIHLKSKIIITTPIANFNRQNSYHKHFGHFSHASSNPLSKVYKSDHRLKKFLK